MIQNLKAMAVSENPAIIAQGFDVWIRTSDPDAKISQLYGSTMEYNGATYSARNTFLIDPAGKIAKVFVKVGPAGHSDEVLAALAELQKS